jgi:gamma-glutamyl:cysteine ligase YbdK (ATP-grasp superfamily)
MDPTREFELWPHGDRAIYQTFDRIFGCAGHGWANLQSAHLNLPFADDDEFGRLHAAVRAVLPLLPAIAAASPFLEGRHPGRLDERLAVYATNARRVPSVTGAVIPEPVFGRADYEAMLGTIYDDLAPLDPDAMLRHEWVNARGAIARFDRMAVEIRVLDVQECPRADIAIAHATSRVLERLCAPDPPLQRRLRALDTQRLARLLRETVRAGGDAAVDDRDYLTALGLEPVPRPAREVWRSLIERDVASAPAPDDALETLGVLIEEGCLAERLLRRIGDRPDRSALRGVYGELAECLTAGRLLRVAR